MVNLAGDLETHLSLRHDDQLIRGIAIVFNAQNTGQGGHSGRDWSRILAYTRRKHVLGV
jgi:hypothetical protein